MTEHSSKPGAKTDQAELEQLRNILFGYNGEQVTQVMRDHARQIVSEVVVEALHDRQRKDDALTHILTPVVNKSVESSVQGQSEKFVGYFYPIVGRLVRKSVTAFLAEFIEKTNEILENSLTLKSFKWRFKAWRAGMSFSQYVASQTFVYRVEQVLLIHNETGILLNSVSFNEADSANGELVSAMLTAINDFVTDSFNRPTGTEEQNLEVIKTADFSLVIKRGPSMMLVAAVKGNIPQDLSIRLEDTNETIHQMFISDVSNFSGDTTPFEATTPLLQPCLVTKNRDGASDEERKPPYLAIGLLSIVSLAVGALIFNAYEHQQRLTKVMSIGEQPGIVVNHAEKAGWRSIRLDILRDPSAVNVSQWLRDELVEPKWVDVTEKPFLSLEPQMVNARVAEVIKRYPSVEMQITDTESRLSGELSFTRYRALFSELVAVSGIRQAKLLSDGIEVSPLAGSETNDRAIRSALLQTAIAKINQTEIAFESGSSSLTASARAKLTVLADQMVSTINLAQQLSINVGLIVMGASDATGANQFNQQLSEQRAQTVRQYLIAQGVEPINLYAIGLGVLELNASGNGVRKVIFNVITIGAQ